MHFRKAVLDFLYTRHGHVERRACRLDRMKTFIRAIEVWVPSADRTMLEFGGGLYGDGDRASRRSAATLCFGRGEGLPGQAWEQGRPLVLKDFEGSYFRRTAAAHAEGITCGIAVPIFAGDFLTAVLVIFCGDDAAHAGAIELWHNDPERVARHDARRRLLRHAPPTPSSSSRAAPASAAAPACRAWPGSGAAGVLRGPRHSGPASCAPTAPSRSASTAASRCRARCRGDEHYVLAFLSALDTPIARRFEIWKPDAGRARLRLDGGFCEARRPARRGARAPRARSRPGHDRPGVPHRRARGQRQRRLRAGRLGRGGDRAAASESLLAVPVIQQGRLVAAVAWYF